MRITKCLLKSLFFLLILVSLSSMVLAVGIRPSKIELDFMPNLEKEYIITVWDAPIVELYKAGELADYVTFNETSVEGRGDVKVSINLPEHLDIPGRRSVFVGALESNPNSGTVSAVAAVQMPIYVNVPYDGKYITTSFSLNDASVGDNISIEFSVTNKGTEDILNLLGVISIESYPSNDTVKKFLTEKKVLLRQKTASFDFSLDTSKLNPGNYIAKLEIFYDDFTKKEEKRFRVGELSLDIVDYPKTIYNGTINKFPITVRSGWSDPLRSVYAVVDVLGANGRKAVSDARMPTVDLAPWGSGVIKGYLDSGNLMVGYYDLEINVYYEDSKTTIKDRVKVIDKPLLSEFQISTLNILLISVIGFLILIDLVWFIVIKGRRKKNEVGNVKISGISRVPKNVHLKKTSIKNPKTKKINKTSNKKKRK